MKNPSIKTVQMAKNRFDSIEQMLLEKLPSGSGINGEWKISQLKNGNIVAKNSLQRMNDVGFYDGWIDFSVVFPLSIDGLYRSKNFRLVAHNWCYRVVKYWLDIDWKTYIDETIYQLLPNVF